jgi:hypothetical protein
VDCITAVEAGDAKAASLSADGYLLPPTTLVLDADASALDALRATELVVLSASSVMGTYVSSIASLAERDVGGQSGWVYYVNGVYANTASSVYQLSDGDNIQWRYTVTPGDLP